MDNDAMTHGWQQDVLGPDWVARTLDLPGGDTATLVRKATPPASGEQRRRAVLYVHGFVDYFFQTHLGDAFEEHGYAFYAIDLRGYGRSLAHWTEAGKDPNMVDDLSLYAQDLDAAAAVIRAEGHDELVVVGHSTGGLVASLWVNGRPGKVAALVLNSPWFDLNSTWFDRVVSTRVVDVVGRLAPRLVVGSLDDAYGRALHAGTGGEWDYDLGWKPHEGFPVRAGWLRQIRRAHAQVARGLHIQCPVLVLTSTRSGPHKGWHPEVLPPDSVLDVQHIKDRAPGLGDDVTLVEIEGGAHDLVLSPEPARSAFLAETLTWLDRNLPPSL
jgi:alpha-beta hydrolase superfamily lysophospholipase